MRLIYSVFGSPKVCQIWTLVCIWFTEGMPNMDFSLYLVHRRHCQIWTLVCIWFTEGWLTLVSVGFIKDLMMFIKDLIQEIICHMNLFNLSGTRHNNSSCSENTNRNPFALSITFSVSLSFTEIGTATYPIFII